MLIKTTIYFGLIFILISNVFSQSSEIIKIGVFADMTGQNASFGISNYSGIKMAADEINSSGGINGRKIEILLEDNQGSPENTKLVVERLIKEKQVHALLGEVISTNSLIAAPIAQAAKIPMITPSSTNQRVTKVGDYIFRTCFIDEFQGEAMAIFAFENLKLKRVAILTDSNSEYSKGLSKSFATTFTRLGGRIVNEKKYVQGDDDYFQQLNSIKKSNPQAIYLTGYYDSVGIIAKQARQLKITVPFLGGDGWDSPNLFQISENSLNNSYITDHFSLQSPTEKVKRFSTQYKKLFGLEPDGFAALAYDAMLVLADSIKRANSTNNVDLKNAIAATKDFQGVTGKITLNSSRNANKPAVILKLQNPNFIYNSTVEP